MGLKNIEKAQVLRLGDEVEYQQGQIVSKTLAQNRALSMTLFAFEQDEEISTHTADGDALVTVLDGTGRFTIDGEAHLVSAGESIIMPAHVPHAVYGQTRFKMLLTVRCGGLLIKIKVKADCRSHGRPKCDAAV